MTSHPAYMRACLSVAIAAAAAAACQGPVPSGPTTGSPTLTATKRSTTPLAARPRLDRTALTKQLLPLVQVVRAGRRLARLGDQAAGVISNNGSSFISDQGGGLISDKGSGLVANNGGGLVGKSKRVLLQANDRAPATTPYLGEAEIERGTRPDGASQIAFATGEAETRDVFSRADGTPLLEERVSGITYYPDGGFKSGRTVRRIFGPEGAERARLSFDETFDASGRLETLVSHPSTFQEPEQGINVAIARLELDMRAKTGSFELRYKHLGLVETGTLSQLAAGPKGQVAIDLIDPMALCGGRSEVVTEAGERRYGRNQTLDATGQAASYDLGDGFGLSLRRATPFADFSGTLTRAGTTMA